eukprot:gene12091-13336_t
MLFKVLYTHQKMKKNKVWQDGFLEMSSTGRKVYPDVELESEKYLIQVEHECSMGMPNAALNTSNSIMLHNPPSNMQRVTVTRHGLSSKHTSQKPFRPPLIDRNISLKAVRDDVVHGSLNSAACSHPGLSGLSANYDAIRISPNVKLCNRENASFRNLYNQRDEERQINEHGLFCQLETQRIVGMDEGEKGIGGFQKASNTEPSLFHDGQNTLYANSDPQAIIQTIPVENKYPIKVDSNISPATTSFKPSFSSTSRRNKRSASQILALFSKKSKQGIENRDQSPSWSKETQVVPSYELRGYSSEFNETSLHPEVSHQDITDNMSKKLLEQRSSCKTSSASLKGSVRSSLVRRSDLPYSTNPERVLTEVSHDRSTENIQSITDFPSGKSNEEFPIFFNML